MNRFDLAFRAVHEHHKNENQSERHPDDALMLFALIFYKVVLNDYLVRIPEHFRRRLKRDPVSQKVFPSLGWLPRESRIQISLVYIQYRDM